MGGVDKTLSLQDAMEALNIPSVSLALIDQDRVAFARAYGEGATPYAILIQRKFSNPNSRTLLSALEPY